MRVGRVAILAYEHALDVGVREVRIELAQLIGIELVPADAVVAPQPPGGPVLGEARKRAVDEEVAEALDEMLGPGIAHQRH